MDKDAKVGVVTVTYNSGLVIKGFLQSVLKQTHTNLLLYIVDNNSKDDTLAQLQEQNDMRIRVIPNLSNIGVAAGNNQGIREALRGECDFVLLINNDTEFESQLIERLIEGIFEFHCDITVPKILYHDNRKLLWFAGGFFEPWRVYKNIHEGEGKLDQGQYDIAKRITYAPTCCMLVKSIVFNRTGLMDEKYFVYFDDTDFCLKAYRLGVIIYYTPDANLTHKVSSLTGGETSKFAARYMIRNRVYFARKNIKNPYLLFAYIYIQIAIISRFLFGSDKISQLILKQKAFYEGLRV